MRPFIVPFALLSAVAPLVAQATAGQRTLDGLSKLKVGRWEDAVQEWCREGFITADAQEGLVSICAKAAPQSRTLAQAQAFREPLRTDLWERHYLIATFDGPAIFLVFDWIWHRDMWRLQRLQVAQDPTPFLIQSLHPEMPR